VKVSDIKSYFEHLKTLDLCETTCWNYSVVVKSWFTYAIKQIYALTGQTLINMFDYVDVPFKNQVGGGNKDASTGKIKIEMDSAKANVKVISDQDMEKIVRAARLRSQRLYTFVLILKHTGMRISEAETIRVENIDVTERIIASGNVKDFAKTGIVYFVVPEFVMAEIRAYKLDLQPGEEWLFPAPSRGTQGHVSAMRSELRKLAKRTGVPFTSHWFRHTIIKKREKMGCPPHINEFLQNQAVTGTQARYYRERNFTLRDRRELYDRWNPWN
jgi:integrase